MRLNLLERLQHVWHVLHDHAHRRRAIPGDARLRDLRYVVFDTETTGLHPYAGDQVISLGAVMVRGSQVRPRETFYRLIDPGRPVPPEVTAMTGLWTEELAGQPELAEVLPEFLDFVGDAVLVGHHVEFDLAFFQIARHRQGLSRLRLPYLDTLGLAQALWPHLPGHSLDMLGHALGWEQPGGTLPGRHHALGDARLTARLWLRLLDALEERRIRTWRGLMEYLHRTQD